MALKKLYEMRILMANTVLITYYGTTQKANVEKSKLKRKLFSLSICSLCFSKTFPHKDGLEPLEFLVATQMLSKHSLVPSSPGSVNHKVIIE